jgi:dUTPase
MLLNKNEILSLGLLEDFNEDHFNVVSYDMTAKDIVTLDNKVLTNYLLPPQGMVVVVTKESFKLKDKNIVGFTTVKNALSRKGIMAVNIGLVDPGYDGPISSILINFGKSSFEIKSDDTFLRMTFHKYNPLNSDIENEGIVNVTVPYPEYLDNRRNESNNYLDTTFLYLKDIQNKASEAAKQKAQEEAKFLIDSYKSNFESVLKFLAFGIAGIGLIIAALYNYLNYKKTESNKVDLQRLEQKVDKMFNSNSVPYKQTFTADTLKEKK